MPREIAFIDSNIPELDAFFLGLRPELGAVLLSPNRPAPTQIAEVLREHSGLDAIHIVAHGKPGEVSFASGKLSIETLKEHAADLRAIGDALAANGAALLWSCRTGKGASGAAFTKAFESAICSRAIAAPDVIGSAQNGGTWQIATALAAPPLTAEAINTYKGILLGLDLDTTTGGVEDGTDYTENSGNVLLFGNATISTNFLQWVGDLYIQFNNDWPDFGQTFVVTNLGAGLSVENIFNGGLHIYDPGLLVDTAVWISTLNSIAINVTSENPFNFTLLPPNPPTPINYLLVSANDQLGNEFLSRKAWVNFIPVNDAPVATIAPTNYSATEGVALNLKGTLSVSDVDAANGLLTVTLSAPSGIFGGSAGDSGVTQMITSVTPSQSTMTIVGTLASINNLLGNSGSSLLTYTANSDAPPASVLLTLAVNDGGNTGGGSLTNSDIATINITSVNDAPVNTVPGTQGFAEDNIRVFSSGIGNQISIADPDNANLQISLNATNGVLSLSGIAGLSFSAGDGVSDATMAFSGTVTAINAALNGLTYMPTANYNGPAIIQIQSNDGSLGDNDTVNLTITPVDDPAVFNGTGGADTANATLATLSGFTGGTLQELQDVTGDIFNGLGGNDSITAAAGADVLNGGAGKDTLAGALGADTFDYNIKSETPKGANHDVILDFSGVGGDGDHIDLAGIDANSAKHGNQDFKFINGKFHHRPGELHVLTKVGFFLVEGDINGDGKADFQIEVHSAAALVRDDFLGVIVPAAHQGTHQSHEDFDWFWDVRG
jgi:hypothetical protein